MIKNKLIQFNKIKINNLFIIKRNYCNNNKNNNNYINLFENRLKRRHKDENGNEVNSFKFFHPNSDEKEKKFKSVPKEYQYIQKISEDQYRLAMEKSNEMIRNHENDLNEFYIKNKNKIDEKLAINQSKTAFALVFAYDGTGYYGLSYNKDLKFKSIENVIEKALFINGHISPLNIGDLSRIKWSRSSRTDKGVHSLATLISCSILVDKDTHDNRILSKEIVENINLELPDSIRLLSGVRVSKTFQARRGVCERTYHYLVPKKHLENLSINEMNNILSNFIGNFSFHNYTSRRNTYIANSLPNNRSNEQEEDEEEEEEEEEEENVPLKKEINRNLERLLFRVNSKNVRTVKEFYVENNTIKIGNEEWYRFVVVGESFITFQIRKMMGFFFAVAKGYQSIDALKISVDSPFVVPTPTAPPFSLYLFEFLFDTKNKKEAVNDKELFSNSVKDFKNQFLNNQLYQRFQLIENETKQFDQFITEDLKNHEFFLNDLKDCMELYKEFQFEKEERLRKQKEFRIKREQQKEKEKQEKKLLKEEKERKKYQEYLERKKREEEEEQNQKDYNNIDI